MAQKRNPKYRKRNQQNSAPLVLGLVGVMALFIVLAIGLRVFLNTASVPELPSETMAGPVQMEETTEPTPAPTEAAKISFWEKLFGKRESEPEETLPPQPEHVIAQAKISVTGDILMHMPVINTGLQPDGRYNFDYIFQYLSPYSAGADFAVANLETTLSGTEAGYKYSGYPAFNCPDEIVDALKKAGFDMLLTANNHCYDTSEYGFLRTVKTIRSKGLDTLGTRAEVSEPTYLIKDINGIKVGMVCYTYEGQPDNPVPGVVYMNKNALTPNCAMLISSFLTTQMDPFYMDVRQILADMKAEGAEATVFFIHWGTEYQTIPNSEQNYIAQQLCDIGFDVIVGGHPHVIQPVSLLTSAVDPEHKTVCLYSTGNAVSNQRIKEMDLKTGHTEDGLLFSITFSKYSDDTVYLESAELLPCWVDLREGTPANYDIIPLDASNRSEWQTAYGMTQEAYENAQKSFDRTTELTGAGMTAVQQYLAQQKELREEAYLAAVSMPDAA